MSGDNSRNASDSTFDEKAGGVSIGSSGASFVPFEAAAASSAHSLKTDSAEDSAGTDTESSTQSNRADQSAVDLADVAGGTVFNHGRISLYTVGNGRTSSGLVADGQAGGDSRFIRVSRGGTLIDGTAINGGTIVESSGGAMTNVAASANGNPPTSSGSPIFAMISVCGGATAYGVSVGNFGFAVAGGTSGSGAVISGGTVSGDASLDATGGGTVVSGTAMSGGIVVGAGIQGQAAGYLSDAHIMDGGKAFVGGRNGLTVTKNNSTYKVDGAGTSTDMVVDAGGIADIASNGTELGGKIAGTAIVEGGGTISGALFSGADANNPALGYIDSGAQAINNTIQSGAVMSLAGGQGVSNVADGGTLYVGPGFPEGLMSDSNGWTVSTNYSGGIGYGTSLHATAKNGGLIGVGGSGLASDATVMKRGAIEVSDLGTALGVDVHSNATMIIYSGGYASGATIGAGEDKWGGGGTLSDPSSGNAYVASGGLLSGATLMNGRGKGSTVDEMGGLLRVERGATVTGLVMGHFGQIEVMGVNYGAGESVTYNNGYITLMSNGHSIWGASLAGGPYKKKGFQVWDDNGTAVIVYDVCFLKGTRISTPNGHIEVQNLKEGDLVWTLENGKETARPIRGLHQGRSSINHSLPTDLAGWSVCIKAGAFGDNLPERELHVTPEHCFYFEGKFIPVRMLVNGTSIYYDTNLSDFEYFHFETEPHSIIRAEGVLTESWLNTKERRQAVNLSNGLTRLERLPYRTWEKDAAAPLDVSPAFAEKLWTGFHVRALQNGMKAIRSESVSFDNNPNLRLYLQNGQEIKPANRKGNKYFFQIPAGVETKDISLLSNIFRPSESVGPWIDDRRRLGVLVGKMTVAVGENFHIVDGHLQVANAQGWDVVENSPCRWTKGNAVLPDLGPAGQLMHGFSLIIEVLAGGPYPEQKEKGSVQVLSGASFG